MIGQVQGWEEKMRVPKESQLLEKAKPRAGASPLTALWSSRAQNVGARGGRVEWGCSLSQVQPL